VQPRFEASDDGEEDDESSSLSDDRVSSSHIPREKRAGGDTRSKRRGLSLLVEGKATKGEDVLCSQLRAVEDEYR
jgi:hypothetical protein